MLFEDSNYFKDIVVKGKDDPNLNQLNFAEEVLKQFNSKPNNLGFAVVDAKGNVKMYAFKINELPEPTSRPEMETPKSLGGITIGQALVFKNATDSFVINSPNKQYQITIHNKNLIITPIITNITPSMATKVEISNQNVLSEEDFDKAMKALMTSDDEATKIIFEGITYDNYISEFNKDDTYMVVGGLFAETNPDFKVLTDFIQNGGINTVNVKVNEEIVMEDNSNWTVLDINGTNVTIQRTDTNVDVQEIVDVTKVNLFKKDKQFQDCTTPIILSYGV